VTLIGDISFFALFICHWKINQNSIVKNNRKAIEELHYFGLKSAVRHHFKRNTQPKNISQNSPEMRMFPDFANVVLIDRGSMWLGVILLSLISLDCICCLMRWSFSLTHDVVGLWRVIMIGTLLVVAPLYSFCRTVTDARAMVNASTTGTHLHPARSGQS
jgi:hypothetical protein